MQLKNFISKRYFSKYPQKGSSEGQGVRQSGLMIENQLKKVIIDEIRTKGVPMSLSRFMTLGLLHPEHGYYSTKDKIFNKGGDFTTSPEISQMFGEMIGLWLMTAIKNYQEGPDSQEIQSVDIMQQKELQTINIIEIGPGSGIMMSDIIRTMSQFTGNLKNVQINMIEASSNLINKQQELLLKQLKDQQKMFLTYDLELHKISKESEMPIERFFNKDQNFSIAWYPTLKNYHRMYLEKQISRIKEVQEWMQKLYPHEEQSQRKTSLKIQEEQMLNPCFILAHELYDALPIYQFQYTEERKWRERVISFNQQLNKLTFGVEPSPITEFERQNVESTLNPEKFITKEAEKEIKAGDQIEMCPDSITLTKEIIELVELSRGSALVIDYGEDHAFTNSFRGIKDHKVIKDFDEIVENIGKIDLTSYVNFAQIKQIAQANKNMNVNGPMPQGLFLESMGINMRKEQAKTESSKKLLEDSYYRLCHPSEMGEIYKMLYFGHREAGDIYPFLGEITEKQQQLYG
ncbi:UNKNOWN [Stylonychia lemnae]|uniref:Protein arginine methyltransferase NDUFAF7 n=1 Tax=Stylonychia lemnae TaxID=5949 RepID=A0A077ZSN0_STYLE|nr:UNKNOWN [Stylonychia lemnae]|eukprot:CDW71486.1 UNKNOWN [Stylonychia lemnae]